MINKKWGIRIAGLMIIIIFGIYVVQRIEGSIVDKHAGGTISKAEYNEQYHIIEKNLSVDHTFFFDITSKFLIELQSGDMTIEIWNPKGERIFQDIASNEKTYMNEFVSKPMKGIWKVRFIITPQTEGKYQFIFRSTLASWLNGNRDDWY